MGRWLAPLLPGPQHWVVHDRDADLLEVAAADLPGPAADGAAVTVEARQSDITRLRPERSRRRNPHHRLGAAGPADRGRAGRAGHRLCRRRVSDAADAVRRRSRRADPGGSAGPPRGRRIRRPPAPHDASGAACSARTPSRSPSRSSAGWGPRSSSGPAPGDSAPSHAELAAEWFTGWVGAACEQQVELAAETDAYTRRRLAQASSRRARRHRGPRRPAGPARMNGVHRPTPAGSITPLTAGRRACARPFAPSSPGSGRSWRTGARPSAPARSRSPRTGGAAGPCPGCC